MAYKRSPTSTRCRATTRRRCSAIGLKAVKGDIDQEATEFAAAMRKADDRQPARHVHDLGQPDNPVQDIYLREVEGKEQRVPRVAVKALADPARGCKM